MKIIKTKKVILVVTALVLLSTLPFLQSCNNSDEPTQATKSQLKSESFLSISNITNRNSFSTEEKAIFKEAQKRVVNNAKKNDKGFWSLEHTTAYELNIDKSLFVFFTELYKSAEVSKTVLGQTKNIKANTRMKVGSEINPLITPVPTLCELTYAAVMAVENSKEQKYFKNYWEAKGDMTLSPTDVKDIVNAPGRDVKSSTSVNIGGKQYIEKNVSYTNTDYHYAFGSSAKEYYNASGECVGFSDTYDFNPSSGARPKDDENITRAMGTVGPLCGAKDYNIGYGIH